MAQTAQLTRRVDSAITVYNGTGSDIAEGVALAFDSTNPPTSILPPGVKITTSDEDFVGLSYTTIRNGNVGSMQLAGVGLGVAGDAIEFGTDLSLMTDANGALIPRTAGKRTAGIPLISAAIGEQVMFQIEKSNAT